MVSIAAFQAMYLSSIPRRDEDFYRGIETFFDEKYGFKKLFRVMKNTGLKN